MRIHHPKHAPTTFWHAALFTGAMIALWLLLTTMLPAPAGRPVTTERGMPVQAAALRALILELENG